MCGYLSSFFAVGRSGEGPILDFCYAVYLSECCLWVQGSLQPVKPGLCAARMQRLTMMLASWICCYLLCHSDAACLAITAEPKFRPLCIALDAKSEVPGAKVRFQYHVRGQICI